MNLADKIRNMAELVEKEAIAKALGLPIDIINGVLSGAISDELLDNYDPAKPPDIKVVQKKKIVRSLIIGVVSLGGSGSTTLVSALSTLTAKFSQSSVVAADLNEYSNLGDALGVSASKDKLLPTLNGWVHTDNITDCLHSHSDVKNLLVLLGANNLKDFLEIPRKKFSIAIDSLGVNYEYVFIDCPHSPLYWSAVLPHCDFIIYVIKPEPVDISNFINALQISAENNFSKYGVVFSDAANTGYNLPIRECQKIVQRFHIQNLGFLPHDKNVRKSCNMLKNHVLNETSSPYTYAVFDILEMLTPNLEHQKTKNFFKRLAK